MNWKKLRNRTLVVLMWPVAVAICILVSPVLAAYCSVEIIDNNLDGGVK